MDLAEAKDILEGIGGTAPSAQWDPTTAMAVQRALGELYLLNRDDDVDGQVGPRTRDAWRLFKEVVQQPSPDTLEQASAQLLVHAAEDPVQFMGRSIVVLQHDFPFRRKQRAANRANSVAALIAAARTRGLTKPQIAYVLATAEHESDSFSTLEEYSDGSQYEGRADLGNSQPGDGIRYKGRGYVQLTGRRNYANYAGVTGIKLETLPFVLMNWASLSVFVIVDGMIRGAYTGQRLDKFVNAAAQDFVNARRVVNGLDCAEKIAAQAREWQATL